MADIIKGRFAENSSMHVDFDEEKQMVDIAFRPRESDTNKLQHGADLSVSILNELMQGNPFDVLRSLAIALGQLTRKYRGTVGPALELVHTAYNDAERR